MRITDFRAIFLPYCLDRQPDGRWLVLNREYKPIGTLSGAWVDYSTHPSRVELNGLTQAVPRKLHFEPFEGDTPQRIHLYEDSMSPMRNRATMAAYLDKLELLANLEIRIDD